ncbi:unnamed protein product [Heligmosomoides polygyrus]|uniref:Transposase n=1 Tax=Heligmosomoides polygyrus TaxID=6339 RepID=A0A183GB72_HELPZ|nr:unnamed protein product [Heligmosomoides polygyrus]
MNIARRHNYFNGDAVDHIGSKKHARFNVSHLLHTVVQMFDKGFACGTQKFGVAPIADKMREARLRWYGHVLRGKEDSVRKKGLKFEVVGKRIRLRPKQRWSGTLHMDLKVAGDLALDRERWRHDTE